MANQQNEPEIQQNEPEIQQNEPEIQQNEPEIQQNEPEITVNGTPLTDAQAMAVRVAISSFDADCGYDEQGKAMAQAYTERLNEVFRMMIGKPASRGSVRFNG
jgi:uncharacterized protein (DUF3084 family)